MGSDRRWHPPETHPSRIDTDLGPGDARRKSESIVGNRIESRVILPHTQVFRWLAVGAFVVICATPFLPWCVFVGNSFTLLTVDSVSIIPISIVVAGIGGIISVIAWPERSRRLVLFFSSFILATNVLGLVLAARFEPLPASVYSRAVVAAVYDGLAWGGWLAFSLSALLLSVSLSRWSETKTIRGPEVTTYDLADHPKVQEFDLEVSTPHMNDVLRRRP